MSRIKGKEEEGIRRALEATASTAGRAILYNATAVGLGFLALAGFLESQMFCLGVQSERAASGERRGYEYIFPGRHRVCNWMSRKKFAEWGCLWDW